jgi:large subunit ribosomal protein L25
MDIPVLKAQPRTTKGTKAARAMRAEGTLPLVMYGHGEPPEMAALSRHDFELALSRGARMLNVEMSGATKPYLIKDVQYDHLDRVPIHLDLARVDLDERVTVWVGIELRGVPKGVAEGGILDQLMPDLEVECKVTDIPNVLSPLVTELGVGDSLLVKDLNLPEGVIPTADGNEIVALVRALAEVEEPAAEEGVEGAVTAEPERIGRVRKEEELEGK